jgi:hypothetical protein
VACGVCVAPVENEDGTDEGEIALVTEPETPLAEAPAAIVTVTGETPLDDSPATGESAGTGILWVLLILSAGGLTATLRIKKASAE